MRKQLTSSAPVTKRDLEATRDELAQVNAKAFGAVENQIAHLREEMITKSQFADMEDRLVTHLRELRADVKQVIADEAGNTVELAKVKERLTRVEKKLGLKAA
jgi:hypothetical protein